MTEAGENTKNVSAPEPTEQEPLKVVITDSYSEDGIQYFKISSKSLLRTYESTQEFAVSRSHDEFLWLYNCLADNPGYSGVLLPSKPVEIDFTFGTMISMHSIPEGGEIDEEWIDNEIRLEYLRNFTRSVVLHEFFLTGVASDSILREDRALMMFLTQQTPMPTSSSAIGALKGLAKSLYKMIDNKFVESSMSSDLRSDEIDEEIEKQKIFLKGYIKNLDNVISHAASMFNSDKNYTLSDNLLACHIKKLLKIDYHKTTRFFSEYVSFIEGMRKRKLKAIHAEEFKIFDVLRYLNNECKESIELLNRRSKLQSKTKNLQKSCEKAQLTGKFTSTLATETDTSKRNFDLMTENTKSYLSAKSKHRVEILKKNLISYCDEHIKISMANQASIKRLIDILEAEDFS